MALYRDHAFGDRGGSCDESHGDRGSPQGYRGGGGVPPDSVYEPSYGDGAHGIYRDAHPDRTTKAGTTNGGRTIDYILVNDQPVSISTPTITDVDYSDHHVYEATVRVHAR